MRNRNALFCVTRNAFLLSIFAIGGASVSLRAGAPPNPVEPAQTIEGTIMCRAGHARQPTTEDCPARSHFVFVSRNQVYDIKNQSFSGLRPLVGEELVATAQLTGMSIRILQLMELPK
jgi:hypothetical protein